MGGIFGGDSSVVWQVDAHRVRSTTISSNGARHHHEGTDETGENGFFTVTIQLPSEQNARKQFLADLKKLAVPNPPDPIVLRLPIEDKAYLTATTKKKAGQGNLHQIAIDWP
jgi:hypothetical protein